MPAESQAQRGLVFGKRNQYKTKAKTPDKWKWIWDEDWENEGKLPKRKNKNETVQNVIMKENFRAKTINEGSVGFEETKSGEKYLDQLYDELQIVYYYTPEEAEILLDKHYELIHDCHFDQMSIDKCAEMIANIEDSGNVIDETFKDGNFETDKWVDLVIDIDSMSPQEYDLLTSWNNISRVELEGYNDYNLIRFVEDDDEVIDLISDYIVDDNGDLDPYIK